MEKIIRFQKQHSHTLAIIYTNYREGINILDLTWKNSVMMLRKMIMAKLSKDWSKHLFVSLDRNTYKKNNNFTLPKK